MRNWIYCRISDFLGRWPAIRRRFDDIWFGPTPPEAPTPQPGEAT